MPTKTRDAIAKSNEGAVLRLALVRRRQRGAAMVEAAIVIPFFILIYAGLGFTRKVYYEKIRLNQAVRQRVWTQAVNGCSPVGVEPINPEQGSTEDARTVHAGAPGQEIYTRRLGTTNASGDKRVQAFNFLGGYTIGLSNRASIVCNEVAEPANLMEVLNTGYGNMVR